MTNFTATYSPDDNKLRLYADARLDAETFARLKVEGFVWAPMQKLYVAPMWTTSREDLLLELAGEIGDEDASLVSRSEERAERFETYSENRRKDAEAAQKSVTQISDAIPFGQPILVGHHSERRARKDAERMQSGMKKAVKMWETSEYWTQRAEGALGAAKYKEQPSVRARRIKKIEADQRRVKKSLREYELTKNTWEKIAFIDDPEKQYQAAYYEARRSRAGTAYVTEKTDKGFRWSAYDVLRPEEERLTSCPVMETKQVIDTVLRAYDKPIAIYRRWLAHYENRLTYERTMLKEAGCLSADKFNIQPGGRVLVGNEWLVVVRINKRDGKIVSLRTNRRYSPIIGIELVGDYQEPTSEDASKVEIATTIWKQANYPGEGFYHLSKADYEKVTEGYKGFKKIAGTETYGPHRVRTVLGSFIPDFKDDWSNLHKYHFVFLTDAKQVDPPAPENAPQGPINFERKFTSQDETDHDI